mmetsp:Transcript_131033/g.379104  ORF Transcript_131033/g.379104 Transcript_131033/m.379104 type:complete len:244 (+) Transcript_131033:63-794(+)
MVGARWRAAGWGTSSCIAAAPMPIASPDHRAHDDGLQQAGRLLRSIFRLSCSAGGPSVSPRRRPQGVASLRAPSSHRRWSSSPSSTGQCSSSPGAAMSPQCVGCCCSARIRGAGTATARPCCMQPAGRGVCRWSENWSSAACSWMPRTTPVGRPCTLPAVWGGRISRCVCCRRERRRNHGIRGDSLPRTCAATGARRGLSPGIQPAPVAQHRTRLSLHRMHPRRRLMFHGALRACRTLVSWRR